MSLGLLNFLRAPPSGDFPGEWTTVICFSLAALMALPALPRRFVVAPFLFLVPLTLTSLVGLQFFLGQYDYLQFPGLYLGYLALAVLAAALGQGLRVAGLAEETIRSLAWVLLITGLANSTIQLVQAFGLETAFTPYLVRLVGCRPYGNVAQANQATTLAWLAIGSALYLSGVFRLRWRWSTPSVALLLVGSALTGSRMAWLFLGATVLLVLFLPAWPAKDAGMRRRTATLLIVGFFVASYAASLALAEFGPSCISAVERLTKPHMDGGTLVRLELWRQAVAVWLTSPWIGVGAFKVLPTVYEIESTDQHQPLDGYVHNSVLQVLAEFGLTGAVALLAFGLILMLRLAKIRHQLQAADGLILLWIGILGVHSMLEFPLWYTYFLVIFFLGLGLIVQPAPNKPPTPRPYRFSLMLLALAGLISGVGLLNDYLKLDRLFWLEDQRKAIVADTPDVRAMIVSAAADVHFFRVEADNVQVLSEPIDASDLDRKIAETDRLLAIRPYPAVVMRRVALAALAGDFETARRHLRRVFAYFPSEAETLTRSLRNLILRRPEEFASLGPLIDQELGGRPTPRW